MKASFTIAATITSLADVETKFKLQARSDRAFFTEWLSPYLELTNAEKVRLDLIQQQCL